MPSTSNPLWISLAEQIRFSPSDDGKLAKVALFESPRALFDVYCLEPGQQQRVHSHEGVDKIYVALSGASVVTLGSEERPLLPMQAAVAPAGVPHGVRNDSSERVTVLVFQAR